MNLLIQFRQNWKRIYRRTDNNRLLLAVSGGIDSMVMSHLFLRSGMTFGVAHCNYGLRNEASDLDESLVREFAERNNIPFHTVRFDTGAKMQEWNKGLQETARILRYEWLDELRKEQGYAMIATAHHANDNAETLLMNIFKGTGVSGMHGIPETGAHIIRPLLFASRKDIEDYAREHSVAFREDASNDTDAYRRNVIRHHIVPVIERHFPGAVNRMNESIARLSEAGKLYRKAVDAEIRKIAEQRGKDIYIPILKLKKSTAPGAVCYELFSSYGFTAAQTGELFRLLDAEPGKYVSSGTHRVIRHKEFLIITANSPETADFVLVEGVPCVVHTEQATFHFSLKDKRKFIHDAAVACIDARRLVFPIVLRKWKTGDYFYPLGMKMKKKKLSRLFIDLKLPLHEKEHIRVLEVDGRIAWVAGVRLDERFKVTDTTEKVLVVKMS